MEISKDKLVYLQYTLHDADGTHLNPNEGELIYLHGGYGHIFSELENAIEKKVVDDSFKVTLSPEEAFGEYDEELLIKEQLSELPKDIYVGMELDSNSDEFPDETLIFTVMDIHDDYATLNGNHPLAGKTLTFEGVITKIQELEEDAVRRILEHGTQHHD
ncbi:FKBP-type peptidyl-prolyl cis-trans isomerase [Sulfurimonas sp. CS5]|jgi:FKBP-type peptidyl-prolyl cis-trans isomerase SlyD|uniref:FKBP-type peptidyl-prolyl cis-trans isomerase n=1 Tax=Sulfurimonas sp. CS5 TaxID=3391145 RepID=UPI0039EAC21C